MKKKTLFKETDIRIPGSVALQNGWMTAAEFGMLAESYREAAQAVVNALSEDEVFASSMSLRQGIRAYPVFFLYRQALELTLKGIIVAGIELVEHGGGKIDLDALYRTHNFEKLRPDLERVMEEMGWGWNLGIPGFTTIADFRRLLAEFDEFDGNSAVCRYPVNADGSPSMAEQRCINLFDFAETIDAVLEVLDHAPGTIHSLAEDYLSYAADAAPSESGT
ncbi:MAG TPA: hypothetical protein VGJ82_17990 [Thermoanaerobaculia bacterium]|jgi:hypothetical protein